MNFFIGPLERLFSLYFFKKSICSSIIHAGQSFPSQLFSYVPSSLICFLSYQSLQGGKRAGPSSSAALPELAASLSAADFSPRRQAAGLPEAAFVCHTSHCGFSDGKHLVWSLKLSDGCSFYHCSQAELLCVWLHKSLLRSLLRSEMVCLLNLYLYMVKEPSSVTGSQESINMLNLSSSTAFQLQRQL